MDPIPIDRNSGWPWGKWEAQKERDSWKTRPLHRVRTGGTISDQKRRKNRAKRRR